MKKNITKDFIPLLISILLIIISAGMKFIGNYNLNFKHYIGLILISICVFLFFNFRKLYFYIFILTLLSGLLGFIDFFYINIQFEIGPISLNPLFLILIILFLTISKDSLNQVFPEKQNKPND